MVWIDKGLFSGWSVGTSLVIILTLFILFILYILITVTTVRS